MALSVDVAYWSIGGKRFANGSVIPLDSDTVVPHAVIYLVLALSEPAPETLFAQDKNGHTFAIWLPGGILSGAAFTGIVLDDLAVDSEGHTVNVGIQSAIDIPNYHGEFFDPITAPRVYWGSSDFNCGSGRVRNSSGSINIPWAACITLVANGEPPEEFNGTYDCIDGVCTPQSGSDIGPYTTLSACVADTCSAPPPPPGPTGPKSGCWVIFTTDNGFIVRRDEDGNWDIVYTSALGSHAANGCEMKWLRPTPTDTTHLFGIENASVQKPISSVDSGATWSQLTPTGTPNVLNLNTWPIVKDVDGNLYGVGDNSNSVSGYGYYTSIDGGTTWTLIYEFDVVTNPTDPLLSTVNLNFIAENGYLWELCVHFTTSGHTTSNGLTLRRWDLDGANYTTFDFLGGIYANARNVTFWDNNTQYNGYHVGSNRMYYSGFGLGNTSLFSLDVSTPNSPSITHPTPSWGTSTVLAAICPITNSVGLAITRNISTSAGGIWRTTDGGATWTQVLSNTIDLGAIRRQSFNIGVDYDDPNVIWLGNTPPHAFYSTDQGLTWTEEDYNGPSLGAAAHWLSVVASGCGDIGRKAFIVGQSSELDTLLVKPEQGQSSGERTQSSWVGL